MANSQAIPASLQGMFHVPKTALSIPAHNSHSLPLKHRAEFPCCATWKTAYPFPIHLCCFCLQEDLQLPPLHRGHSSCSIIYSAYLMLCVSVVFAGEKVICSLEAELDLVLLSLSLPMLFLSKFLFLFGGIHRGGTSS